ncbi:flagellar export chaperone FliS [Texcoconibacillus texcoconensis]|uniref:Flagellar secretion chaperone FliS n=1 Tax=Texcoconibacillus texcoconensis TaxID=1095777 RepID=A0A840QPR1_9BACI|nr:flagellar export chaperone FliS [Texcoconibacillus texcoconensis]MBB5173406.1 flagellar protein FliS [Texcoconibacillus texcoconensis]
MAMNQYSMGPMAGQDVYRQNAAQTASPGQLTLMLYNGCLKFIKQGRQGIEGKDVQLKNENLKKAQNIISELMVTLKVEDETTRNMLRLYDYIKHQLVQANVHNSLEALDEAEKYVTQFRDTWKEVIQSERKRQHGQS